MAKSEKVIKRDSFEEIKIRDIIPNEYNNNIMDKRTYEILKENIIDNGFDDPIKVYYDEEKKKYVIIDGEHRYNIMKELKQETIPCIIKEIDNEIKKKLLTLSYNKLRGKEDLVKTNALMNELRKKYKLDILDIAKLTGYTPNEVKLYSAKLKTQTERLKRKIKKTKYLTDKEIEEEYKKFEEKGVDLSKFGDIWKLDDHILFYVEPNSRGIYRDFLKNITVNLVIMNIPDKITRIQDLKEIMFWMNTLLKNIEFVLDDDDVSILLEIKNIQRKNINNEITKDYFIHIIKAICDFGYNLKDNITILDFQQVDENFLDMFKTIYHFSKNDIFTFNFSKVYSETNIPLLKNLMSEKLIAKHNKNKVKLPYNVLVNNDIIKNSPNKFILDLYSNEYDIVLETYPYDSKNIILCEEINRKYIGVINNKIELKKIIIGWEKFTNKKAEKLK